MDPTKPKLSPEAIELYNDFIHGEISRRAFMDGVQRVAGGLAVATVSAFPEHRPDFMMKWSFSFKNDRSRNLQGPWGIRKFPEGLSTSRASIDLRK